MRQSLYLLGTILAHGTTEQYACGVESEYLKSAARMIESNVQRGQLSPSNASSAFIEQGVFQNALRVAVSRTKNESRMERWSGYLSTSISQVAQNLTNSTRNAELPLDRFSVGSSLLLQYNETADASLLPAITALQASAALQPRNDDGGLWYYNNVANLSAYRGLSYLDGMYSYPLFAILSVAIPLPDEDSAPPSSLSCDDAYVQIRMLYDRCRHHSGLLVHGYDATKNHSWADPITGASPMVWGRALSWYTLGLLNVLQSPALDITAIEQGLARFPSRYAVWQVVDRQGRPRNFVESSASFFTVYTLLTASRLGLTSAKRPGRLDVEDLARGVYYYNVQEYLQSYGNGTLSLNGTSTVASLRDDVVNYEYYVTRPVATDSLLGTSAFILASLEMDAAFKSFKSERASVKAESGTS